jgi:hypothetical protein
MFWYTNVLSQNRKYPPLSQTTSRVNNHGGENEDLLLTVTIFNEERRYSMHLEDPVAFFTTLATFMTKTHNLFR